MTETRKCPFCHQDIREEVITIRGYFCPGNGDPGDAQYFVESQEADGRQLHPVDQHVIPGDRK